MFHAAIIRTDKGQVVPFRTVETFWYSGYNRWAHSYPLHYMEVSGRARAEPDGTRAETTFRLSPKRTSPFKPAGESVQSTAGSRGVRISISHAGYTRFRGRVRVLATHSIR